MVALPQFGARRRAGRPLPQKGVVLAISSALPARPTAAMGFFPTALVAADPEVAAAIDGELPTPTIADRADRQREHRLAGGARSAGLGTDQQIRRRLSRPPLLRRLRFCRCRRAAGDRARQAAVRLRLRQCAAACRGAGQPGGVSRAAVARRRHPRPVARGRRPFDARRAAEPVGQVVPRGRPTACAPRTGESISPRSSAKRRRTGRA